MRQVSTGVELNLSAKPLKDVKKASEINEMKWDLP